MSREVEKMARGAVERVVSQLVGRLREHDGVDAEAFGDGIVVRGRRLKARWLRDARLRWLGGWM